MAAASPTIRCVQQISPMIRPSTCTSPWLSRLPVITTQLSMTERAGGALGAPCVVADAASPAGS
jgi:hypothetical protein